MSSVFTYLRLKSKQTYNNGGAGGSAIWDSETSEGTRSFGLRSIRPGSIRPKRGRSAPFSGTCTQCELCVLWLWSTVDRHWPLIIIIIILPGPAKSRNPPKFTKSSVFNSPIVSETYLNQHRQPLTSSDQRTLTVDEIEVASSLNFSILIECSVLNACECVDFTSSTVFRRIR